MSDETKQLKSYCFSVGNSSSGPVGMCLRVQAYTPAEAVKKGNAFLVDVGNTHEIGKDFSDERALHKVEYWNVYLNSEGGLTEDDIEDIEDANPENVIQTEDEDDTLEDNSEDD